MDKIKYNSMEKLDRIEYLLLNERLSEKLPTQNLITFLNRIIPVMFYVIIIALLLMGFFNNYLLMILTYKYLVPIFLGFTICLFFLDVVIMFIKRKKLKELNEEFIKRGIK